jgi:hypothetical protein
LAYPAARATAQDKAPLYNWSSGCLKSNLEDNASDQPYKEDKKDKRNIKQYKQQFYDFYNLPTALQHNRTQDFGIESFCLLHVLVHSNHLNY